MYVHVHVCLIACYCYSDKNIKVTVSVACTCIYSVEGYSLSGAAWFRWYPSCGFVQQQKGADFIRCSRVDMTRQDLATADLLHYNNSGTDLSSGKLSHCYS